MFKSVKKDFKSQNIAFEAQHKIKLEILND